MTDSPSATADLRVLRERLAARYAVERELGRGGMGAVYLARDLKLDRLVALKVLPPEFAVQVALRERFLRETRTAASFSHPNIVPVYAVEESDDFLAYAMGYVEGESVMERVRRAGPLSVRDTVKMMQDVAYALAYAHGRGIVHRDIKPDNIMLDRASGRALVMDFGIARGTSNTSVKATSAGLTRVGEVVGTPEYMSPEQASGDDVDGRSDLYSLGLAVMFAVTGKQAVVGETTQKVLVKQLTERLPSVATMRADLPRALVDAVDRCVLKDPDERFATAEELVEALDAAQLAAPEIPLSVRLFANELQSLSMMVGIWFIVLLLITRGANPEDPVKTILFLTVIAAVLIARLLQTLKEAGRLASAGFPADEVLVGLERVVDESAARRAELLADPTVVRARRRTVVIALGMIVGSVALFALAMSMRVEYEPGYFRMGLFAGTMVMSAASMLGVSVVLLAKSPLRMPLGERVFRALWLGPLGRRFVRFGGRRARAGSAANASNTRGGNSVPSRRLLRTPVAADADSDSAVVVSPAATAVAGSAVAPVAIQGSVEDRLARVEGRLAALERASPANSGSESRR